jgi:predicted amidophosphoribosyltransferase
MNKPHLKWPRPYCSECLDDTEFDGEVYQCPECKAKFVPSSYGDETEGEWD